MDPINVTTSDMLIILVQENAYARSINDISHEWYKSRRYSDIRITLERELVTLT